MFSFCMPSEVLSQFSTYIITEYINAVILLIKHLLRSFNYVFHSLPMSIASNYEIVPFKSLNPMCHKLYNNNNKIDSMSTNKKLYFYFLDG